jgi:hypothetical protein
MSERPGITVLRDMKAKIQEAICAQLALDWLVVYLPAELQAMHETTLTIRPTYGSSCLGAPEAREYLERAAREMLPAIINRAEFLALKDIETGLKLLESR